MAARRAASEQVIRGFFASPASSRSLFPPTVSKAFAPLEQREMEKLGRLAALEVSNKSDEFRTSVAQVLDFCGAVAAFEKDKAAQARAPPVPPAEVPFEPPEEDPAYSEQATEGGNAEQVLRNAKKTQEGLFVAPMVKPDLV